MDDNIIIHDRFSCNACADKGELGFDFSMAFQPIVDCQNRRLFGYEALVRGLDGEPAGTVIAKVSDDNLYLFDQLCRVKAIALAAELDLTSILSINFLPNAVYKPERCIRTTLSAAKAHNFPLERIMFEFTESEQMRDSGVVKEIVEYYKRSGFLTAVDDFGAGYAGLGLLADFQTNLVKFDMALMRNIERDYPRQRIVVNCLKLFEELGITALAEGVETLEEMRWLKQAGVRLMQGYLFAKPGFESLPSVDMQLLDV